MKNYNFSYKLNIPQLKSHYHTCTRYLKLSALKYLIFKRINEITKACYKSNVFQNFQTCLKWSLKLISTKNYFVFVKY